MNDPHVTSEDLAPLEAVMDEAYPARLREVAEHLFLQLVDEEEQAPDPARAQQLAEIAMRQTERLSLELGGGNFYMHKGVSFRLTPRNREMCAKFTGNNYDVLALQYNLSDMRVRQIIGEWQLEQFTRRQGTLPGLEKTAISGKRRQGR